MGDVWKAEDTKLGRSVALKLLASHLLRDDEARKRFHREAQAAAALTPDLAPRRCDRYPSSITSNNLGGFVCQKH